MPFKGIRKMSKKCEDNKRSNTYYKKGISDFLLNKEIALSILEKAGIEASTRGQQCTLDDFIRLYECGKEYYDC